MSAGTMLALAELLNSLLTYAAKLSAINQRVQAEGRTLSDEEWQEIIGANNAAMDRLIAEIERARTEGR